MTGARVRIAAGIEEALADLVERPGAVVLAGGTDLMVEVNFGRARPRDIVVIDRLAELRQIERNGVVRVGAGVTFAGLLREDAGSTALREASRTVGSPQIRSAATLGGNLGTCSPAGDALPVLAALDAVVVLRSAAGERRVPFGEYMTGPKRSVRRADELIVAAEWRDAGPLQTFVKIGTRSAMVIAVASLALVVDGARRRVGVALGSCGPRVLRAPDAERFAGGLFDEGGWERARVSDAAAREFGRLVAGAARPIDDVRGTAAYRRHVLGVVGARALARIGAMS